MQVYTEMTELHQAAGLSQRTEIFEAEVTVQWQRPAPVGLLI